MDIVGAAILLLITAPLWIVVAIAIKLDSPGPVLFRQSRIGRGGKPFKLTKFRSMVVDAEARREALLAREPPAELARPRTRSADHARWALPAR